MADAIRIQGLDEFRQSLAAVEPAAAIQMATQAAGAAIIADAKARVPRDSGAAQASIRGEQTPAGFTVVGGGGRAPYFGWLEYGGRLRQGPDRPRDRDGRYIGGAFKRYEPQLQPALEAALTDELESAGLEVH